MLGKRFTKVVRSNGKNISHSSMEHLIVSCCRELNSYCEGGKTVRLFYDVKKACYPKPVKTNTILVSKKQMQYACNN